MRNSIIILSGYNNRGIIAFCRFCKENDVKFFIVASSSEDKILISQFRENVISIRKSDDLDIEEFYTFGKMIRNEIITDKIIILPSTEFLNRFILQNRVQLENNDFVVPLCNSELYNKISDKFSFSKLCKSHGINIPREYDNIENVSFPFVIKPKRYFGKNNLINKKPQIITTKVELSDLKEELDSSKYYYQEFIGGRSFYLLYFFNSDGDYTVFSQENLIQQSDGLSIIAATSSDIHNSEISEQFAKLLISHGFLGLIMIEVKLHNEQFSMIEANPRLWGPSQLILDSNMDLFHNFAIENRLLDSFHPSEYLLGINYLWTGGIIQDQREKKNVAFHNYSPKHFFENYHKWILSDILNREDTKQIYESELN